MHLMAKDPTNAAFPYRKWIIGQKQLRTQHAHIQDLINDLKKGLKPESPAGLWRVLDELGMEVQFLKEQQRILRDTAYRRPTWWDHFCIWLYDWAVRGRFLA